MNSDNIRFFVVIADRKKKGALLEALCQVGCKMVNSLYAKGSVSASAFMDAFGFAHEENKVLITFLLPGEKADAALDLLTKQFHFNKPNTGIAFTIPVEGLSH
ncbi:MAG: hypothetical protein VB099_00675 [Candidatus Limiplasma sp.]|nr:hypothetical protein [Candidatus Limiplasma sp.]